MAFTVVLSRDESAYHTYGDNDVYDVKPSGALRVTPAKGDQVFHYAAGGWIFLRSDKDHASGKVKGRASGGMTAI